MKKKSSLKRFNGLIIQDISSLFPTCPIETCAEITSSSHPGYIFVIMRLGSYDAKKGREKGYKVSGLRGRLMLVPDDLIITCGPEATGMTRG